MKHLATTYLIEDKPLTGDITNDDLVWCTPNMENIIDSVAALDKWIIEQARLLYNIPDNYEDNR